MNNFIKTVILILLFSRVTVNAQLTPQEAIKSMARGINMGNTLEPPTEGAWGNPPVVAANFDDYKNAGFTCVRLPITWDGHTSKTSPYTITKSWLDRIDTIVKWGLSRKLIIIINAHHEAWIKNSYTPDNVARFDSIWSQIATRFKDRSDSLLFEIINEPNPMAKADVDSLNFQVLRIIRKANPTRIVLFSGYMWSNSAELLQAAIPNDSFLIGYYHSYDPYPFGLVGTGTYGTDGNIAATELKFQQVANWSAQHNIPVVLSEFGFISKCDYNSRMCAYATDVDKALVYNVAFNAWEDGGDFKFYNRPQHTWSEIKDILIHTYPISPYKMKIGNYTDTLVQLSWKNRTSENDSIIVQRGTGSALFADYAKIAPTDSTFVDTNTFRGKSYYYRLRANFKDSIEIQSYPIMINNISAESSPWSGTAMAIPGTLQAENFDIGIEGQTYHDADAANKGGEYRPGVGVDIYKTGGIYYVGNTEPGEWMQYSVDLPATAFYSISAYVADTVGGAQFILDFGNKDTVSFTTETTSSSTSFQQISKVERLEEGVKPIYFKVNSGQGFNVDKFNISLVVPIDAASSDLVSVYPNPASDKLYISGLKKSTVVRIYNISGELIESVLAGKGEDRIDISKLKDGMYILNYTLDQKTYNEKFVKHSGRP